MSATNTTVTMYHLRETQKRLEENRKQHLAKRYGTIIRIPGIQPFAMRLSDEDRAAYEKIQLLEAQTRKRAARANGRDHR